MAKVDGGKAGTSVHRHADEMSGMAATERP
jgi:hypothetical protein